MVYEWEHGRCEPSFSVLMSLSEIFDCTVDFLIGRTDDFGAVAVQNSLTREERLLKAFKRLNDITKEKLIEDAEFYAQNTSTSPGITVIKK